MAWVAKFVALAGVSFVSAAGLAFPLTAQSLDGVWTSDGYGTLVEARGDRILAFEITSISCIPTWTADRVAGGETGAVVFKRRDTPAKFALRPGSSSSAWWFQPYGAASSARFRRVTSRPASCGKPTANDPETTFEVLWTTFAEQYGFFGVRGVDWPGVYRRFRPQVTATTTPAALFDIFKAMLEPLHDAHTYLAAKDIDGRFHGSRTDPNPLSDKDRETVAQIIQTRYLKGALRSWCNGRVGYGVLNDSTGYLRISGFSRYTDDGDYEHGTVALEAALDTIFQDGAKLRGLVIDVRVNGGGNDPWGVAVASRLTAQPYLAFAKEARADLHDASRWTPSQESRARHTTRPHFLGRVVELTGINSVSAAETFTMALMGRTPHITRIGESTQGVFSDVLGRTLPNGWNFGLPNERFLTQDGVAFDGPGVPPDEVVPVFPKSDLESGRDGALERALQVLAGP